MTLDDHLQLLTLISVILALALSVWHGRVMLRQSAVMFAELSDHVTDSLMRTHTDQRTTFFLQDPEFLRWHLESRGYRSTTPLEDKERLYALVKLDTHEAIHLRHAKGTIDEPTWRAWRQVLEVDLRVPVFADVWPNGRQFYTASFVVVVDEVLAINASSRMAVQATQARLPT